MNNTTELVFILDKSGSMSGLESDTIGGFNSMIEKQKKQEGKVFVTTILFDHTASTLHDRAELATIEPLTERDYCPCGSTALLDALGGAIEHISTIHKYARPEDVPRNTMFVITTDGMENASHRYEPAQVRAMIEAKRSAGWEFLFLGANIDAVAAAKEYGISEKRAVRYCSDSRGTRVNFDCMSRAISSMRVCESVDDQWSEDAAAYFEEIEG